MTAVEVCPICDIAGCRHIRERKVKMTHPTDEELDALVSLAEEFVTATWHLLDNSETSGPVEEPTIAVWEPNFCEVSNLLDRCEALPSGSTEHMTAGELLAANMNYAITALRTQLAEVQADLTFMTESRNKWQDSATQRWFRIEETEARTDRAEAEVRSLKAAIFGSENYAHDLKCENFVEMAQTLHAAQKGGLDRAERAEAALTAQPSPDVAALVEALEAALSEADGLEITAWEHDARAALARVKGGE